MVVWIGQQMFDHSPLKTHPPGQVLQNRFVNTLVADPLSNCLCFFAFIWTFHREVRHHGLFPITVHHVPANVGRYGPSRTEPLWTDPIWKPVASERGFHGALDTCDLFKGFIVVHGRTIRMATATDHDGEAVSSVVAESNFLMGSAQDFDFHIGQLNFSNFVHRSVNDEEL